MPEGRQPRRGVTRSRHRPGSVGGVIDDEHPMGDDAYFALLGRLAAASASLELLIYWIGRDAFEIPLKTKPGSVVAREVAALCDSAPFTVPADLDLTDWAAECVQAFERRNALIHAASMFQFTWSQGGITLAAGAKRTQAPAGAPLVDRRKEEVQSALDACWAIVKRTSGVLSAVASARRAQEPGWTPKSADTPEESR